MAAPGAWCANNQAFCDLVWWCSPTGFAVSSLVGCGLWGASFLVIVYLLFPMVRERLERIPSSESGESGPGWFAWHVQSTLHALLAVSMSLMPTWRLSVASKEVQLDIPTTPSLLADMQSIALAAHIFACYIAVDTVVTLVRRAMTPDYMLHHVVFLAFSALVMYHCFAIYMAGWLLLMETSTIFLNVFSFFLNRLSHGHLLVQVSFVLFATSFVTFRLAGTTYITAHVCSAVYGADGVAFKGVPRWHLHAICATLVTVVILQFFWAVGIAGKTLRTLRSGKDADAGPAESLKHD